MTVASVYVPERRQGLRGQAAVPGLALDAWAAEAPRDGRLLIFCGDLNVARART